MSAPHLSSLLLALLPAVAFAQAPPNDFCPAAEVLTFDIDGLATASILKNQVYATDAGEAPASCAASPGYPAKTVWYTFTAPVTGTYGFETCGNVAPGNTSQSNYTHFIALYTGTCAGLTQVPGACVTNNTSGASCSPGTRMSSALLDGGFDAGAMQPIILTAGTQYYLQLGAYTSVTYNESSQLRLRVGYEQVPQNDTCQGNLPALALGRALTVATRGPNLNFSVDNAQLPGDAGCFQPGGSLHTNTAAPGQDLAVRFTPPADGTYSLRLSNMTVTSANAVIYLTNGCVPGAAPTTPVYHGGSGGQCVAAANRGLSAAATAEELSCLPLQGGTNYTLWVDAMATHAGFAANVEAAVCYPEAEPNDQPSRATQLSCPMSGGFSVVGDVDFFSVGRYPGAKLFALMEMNASGFNDSQLRVTTETDTLHFDEDDAPTNLGGQSSVVAGVDLPDAPTFLETNYRGLNTVAGPYRLHSMLKFGPPVAEREPNDTRAQATDGTWVRGTVTWGTSSEVDIFQFEAREGELVFVALDANPNRTTAANIDFEVFDALGWSAGVGNKFSTTSTLTPSTPGVLNGTTPLWPGEGYAFRATTTGTHYVHVIRTSAVGSGEYHLAISTNCGMQMPSLTAVQMADGGTPATGSVLGNETLTLVGTGFDQSSQVTINGVRATVTNVAPTALTITTPGGNDGPVPVSVTNFGNLTSTLPGSFTYISPIAPPTIAAVTPPFGAMTGGSVVTLTGSLFKPGAEVSFTNGSTTMQATLVSVTNATSLTCVTPVMPAGLATVTVRNPVDDLSGSLADGYRFVPGPTVSNVSPSTGLISGGDLITITGTGFFPGATVRFGTVNGTNVVVAGDGLSLTVTVPAVSVAGAVALTVRNVDLQQAVVTNGYTYVYPPPTIASVSPGSGLSSGNEIITITGTGFLNAPPPVVMFGTTPAQSVSRLSITQLAVRTPAGLGPVDVVVTNNDGQSVTRAQGFTFRPGPAVSSLSPARGPMQGGTRLTITGQNFVAGARVTIAGVPAVAPLVVDSSTINVATNAGPVGPADVRVENPDTQFALVAHGFTYDAAPGLSSLSPTSGTLAGGTVVTLTGSGFRAGATVFFGVLPATDVTVTSDTSMTANTPASPLGVVSMRVTNDDGQTATLARSFRFVAPPTLTEVSPATGDGSGNTVVHLTGTNFNVSTAVTFGGVAAARVSFVSTTELEAVTPAHAPGAVEVRISNANGDTAALADAFSFTRDAPTVTSFAPASGLTTGGVQVYVTGTNFSPNAAVTFGGVAATAVVVASPELLRVIAPAHAAGEVDLVVTNDDGQAATLARGFTYVTPAAGGANVVTDGGDGALIGDAGTGPTTPTGCGCSGVDGSVLAFAALGLLIRRRRVS